VDGTGVTLLSGSFQTSAAATEKVQSPTVDNRVRQPISDDADAEQKRPRAPRSEHRNNRRRGPVEMTNADSRMSEQRVCTGFYQEPSVNAVGGEAERLQ